MRCGSMHPRISKNVHQKYSSITLDFVVDILCPKVCQYRWATRKHFHTTKFFYAKFCSNVKKILRPQPYKGFFFSALRKII